MKQYILMIRPHQWVKNLFVFLPLFFSGRLFDFTCLVPSLLVFLAFSLVSSGIYCLNDILDVEADRLHPQKCHRPLASGKVSQTGGYTLMILCWIIGYLFCVLSGSQNGNTGFSALSLLTIYLFLNIAYCLWLKRIAIIDVFVIAVGFVIRIIIGGAVTGIWISQWIILMTFLLALFLAFAKRRDDILLYEKSGVKPRENIVAYTKVYLDQIITLLAGITIVAYILYTVSPDVTERFDCQYVFVTSVFVLMGMLRYLQLIFVDNRSGSPSETLLHDRFLQVCIVAWILSFMVILYI